MDEEQAIPAAVTVSEDPSRVRGLLRGVWKFARKKPLGAFGFLLIFFLFAMTLGTPKAEFGAPSLPDRPFGFELGSPWMQRYDDEALFTQSGYVAAYESPSAEHWLGTDKSGRDTWSRVVNGARRSLFVGVWALVVATIIGAGIGIASGFWGGWLDLISQRFMDALQSFPALVALILIVTINPTIPYINDEGDQVTLLMAAIALGLVGIPGVQRITRGVVLSVREQQYIDAARVIGATDARIMWGYILPNIFSSIIVVFSTGIGVVILAEAGLTFIVPDKLPDGTSWGFMLADSYSSLGDAPWPGIFSAAAISLAVLGFNLAGDALRDVLDPRLRQR
ncbi:MAG: ABC transporter permease [Deltaproteobacteria bacterium]|nr:ABC transporter permease [Deltaproteobacteria bacterium]